MKVHEALVSRLTARMLELGIFVDDLLIDAASFFAAFLSVSTARMPFS